MINFIKLDDYSLINVNEIMYVDANIDEHCEYTYLNIIMRDGKHFQIPKAMMGKVWNNLLQWTGAE